MALRYDEGVLRRGGVKRRAPHAAALADEAVKGRSRCGGGVGEGDALQLKKRLGDADGGDVGEDAEV